MSMKFNFRTASATREENKAKLDALQDDFIRLMNEGGYSAIEAEPKFKMRAAQLIRQTVIDEFSMSDPTPIFTERREARLGDKVEFEQLLNGFRVVQYAPLSHPQIFSPTKGKYTIKTAQYELPFGIDLMKVLLRQHSVAEMTSMAAQALTRHYVKLTLTAIDTACQAGAQDIRGRALRTAAAGADVTQPELDAALRRMGQYNSGITIFGSRYALDPIFAMLKTDGGDDIKSELQRRGLLGFYRGAKIVALEDDYNMYTGAFTTVNGQDWEKLIFIAGAQPGATLLERDLSPLNWEKLDVETGWFRTGVRFDHGITVSKPWRYHVIDLV